MILLLLALQESQRLAVLPENFKGGGYEIVEGRAVWWTPTRVGDGKTYDAVGTPAVGRRVAYRAESLIEGSRVVVDGVEGPAYAAVSDPILSADGATVAYTARVADGKTVAVIDGVASEPFDEVWPLRFAPAGRKAMYVAGAGAKKFVVFDGKRGEPFDAIGAVGFSADGSTVAYVAQAEGRRCVVVGGKRGPDHDWVDFTPVLSADGSRVAYAARKGTRRFVMVDGQKGEAFDDVGLPFIGPDGKTVAYQAKKGGRGFVVVGDRRSAEYDDAGWPYFSPDGRAVAFAASKGDTALLVVDGKAWTPQHRLGTPVWSPDSKHMAVTAATDVGWIVLRDDVASEPYDALEQPVFGATGTLAYVARRGDRVVVVVGGASTTHRDARTPVFSPDGSKAAYAAKDGAAWCVIAGAKRSADFDEVRGPAWSPDGPARPADGSRAGGRRVAFGARKGRELWWIFMDVE